MKAAASGFVQGMAALGRGFATWRRRPGLMALGLVPAVIVGAGIVVLAALFVAFLGPITSVLTFFAEEWAPTWRDLLRILIGIALVIAVLALSARVYTALVLMVGGPFYERIATAVEDDHGGAPGREPAFWSTVPDYLLLVLASAGMAILLALLGLVPVIGAIAAAVIGFWFTARALAIELTLGPLAARGLDRPARRAVRRQHRARMLGFGVAVQLCFLVPLGAIVAMPAAVAGAVLLTRDLLGENRSQLGPNRRESAPIGADEAEG